MVKKDDGSSLSIVEYFKREYNYKIQFPDMPTLHVGNPQKDIYLPIELTRIKQQPCPASKKLSENGLPQDCWEIAM